MRSYPLAILAACCLAAGILPNLQSADAPAPSGKVRQIKVLADKAPDCSTLKTIVNSVTRGCKTNDEKAVAIYDFMQLAHYHQNYPGEKGGLGALKEINVYGWSLCGGLHTVEAALWRELGWKWRYVGWSDPGHTTVEAEYDGRWHYLDSFLKFYTWMPDPKAPGRWTIAGEEDIKANPALVSDGLVLDRARGVYYHKGDRFETRNGKANWLAPSFLCCGDEPPGILTGIKSSKRAGSGTGWASLQFDSPGYSTDVNLSPGFSLTLTWDAVKGASWWNGRRYTPGHGCGDKDYRNCPSIGPILEPYNRTGGQRRSFANGTLSFAPDLANDAFLNGLAAKENVKIDGGKLTPADATRPASITVELQSPYIMTRASGKADGIDQAEISLDGGKTFKAIHLEDFSEAVGGQYACLVKLSFKNAIDAPRLEAIVQCNRCSLPYLSPGRNKISVAVADAKNLGDNRLAVTYAYRTGSRNKSYEEIADAGAEVARAHYATWSDKTTVVQKIFTAKDLPATFDIDVPTPKGKYPVYPRMVFLRREVLAPGSKPLPLPAGAETPTPSRPEELKTLPNPFAVGITPPSSQARPSPKRTRSVAPAAGADVPKGEVSKYSFDKSKIFPGSVRDYWIYVPKQYDPAKPACVYVGQDGVGFNAPAVFDRLIHAKEMPVVIGVFVMHGRVKAPSDKALDRFNRSYEYDGLGDNYARFLLEELLPEVEKKTTKDGRAIRLSHQGNDRCIGGASSGAVCAFTAAWERPDAFSRVFSAIGTYVGLRGANNYPTLIRKYEPKPLRVFLQDGSADLNIYGGDWWMANQEMERALRFAGYEVNHAWGEGDHSGKHGTEVFPDAMRWLWKDWPTPVKAGAGSAQLKEILVPGEDWKLVGKDYKFTEGPAVNAKGEVFFNDVPDSKTYKIGLDDKVSVFLSDTKKGDGQAFGPDGRLYAVAGGTNQILAYDESGKASPIAEGFRGNDLVVRHDGSLYVTNPGWNGTDPSKIWYISPKGDKRVVDTGLKFSNGLTLSPDQALLYVADSRTHWVYSYQIRPDGSLAHKQRYYHLHVPDTADDSGADGMRVDRDGRLYVATRLGIQICDQAGRVNCIVPTPNGKISNLCFGGADFDTLFATCGDNVYKRKVKVRGSQAYQEPHKPAAPHL